MSNRVVLSAEPRKFANEFAQIDRGTRLEYLTQMLNEMRDQALLLEEETLANLIEIALLEAACKTKVEKIMHEYMAD